MRHNYRLSTLSLWSFSATFLVGIAIVVAVVNYQMKQQAIAHAEQEAMAILRQNSAINDYFVRQVRPHITREFGDTIRPGYFEPTWMSAGYAVRNIFKQSHTRDGTQFKISSPNARTNDYNADRYERAIIKRFETHPEFTKHTAVRHLGSEDYLVVMIPGQYLTEGCMRCHSTPDRAPEGLVEAYGPVKGFHRQEGSLSSAFTVKVPLTPAFTAANALSLKLSGLLVVILSLMMTALYYFNSNYIIAPIAQITRRMNKIVEGEASLGQQVKTRGSLEFQQLGNAFNHLSGKLKQTLDERESAIAERTSELEKSRAMFRAMFENMQNSVAVYTAVDNGRDFIFTDFNAAAERTEGVSRDKIVGTRLSDFIDIEDHVIIETLRKVWTSGKPEVLPPTLFGPPVNAWRENFIFKLESGEVVAVYNDVTERENDRLDLIAAKEAAEVANHSKGEFLANMSHEIRTPLNGLFGMLQLLKTSPLDAEQREYVELALSTGRGLLQIINDILDFSRMENHALILESAPYDPREPLNIVRNAFEASLGDKNVPITTDVDPAVPERLMGDSGELRQILFNLVGNAAKFTEQGHVHVSLFPLHRFGTTLLMGCSVEDTGIGIPQEKMADIFMPFVQGDQSNTKRHQGTGLGLGIVRRLVSLMGGTISYDETEGGGSTFLFTFEAGLCDAVEPVDLRRPTGIKRPCRILIAEDDRVNQIFITRALGALGHVYQSAPNGKDALALLRTEEFDGVFMDIQMPLMDGIEATRIIRSGHDPDLPRDIPIVALTAYAMPSEQKRFLAAGVNACIKKPVSFEDLEQSIALHFLTDDSGGEA